MLPTNYGDSTAPAPATSTEGLLLTGYILLSIVFIVFNIYIIFKVKHWFKMRRVHDSGAYICMQT